MVDTNNNSKTFIIGIIVFVLLVIGGVAFFAKKDVPVDQTVTEVGVTAPAPEGAAMEVAPAGDPTPVPTPSDQPAAAPAITEPTPAEAAPAPEAPAAEAPATEAAPAPAAE